MNNIQPMNTVFELDRNMPIRRHKQHKQECPSCGKKTYVRYISSKTLEYLPYEFGRCDREEKCGYFNKPNNEYYRNENAWREPVKQQPVTPSFIDHNIVSMSLTGYERNVLVRFLINTFGYTSAMMLVKNYLIGTSKHWPGATIFWQIDKECKIRSGKIMLYKPDGHRDKDKHATWAHSLLKLQNFNLKQCFFGEHLLIDGDPETIIGITESEKTAIIANHFFPQYIWLATGGETMLNADKCRVLEGRKVVFFPDLSDKARERWEIISQQVNVQYGIKSIVSDYLEDINDGSDIADHLLTIPIDKQFGNILNSHGYPVIWDN